MNFPHRWDPERHIGETDFSLNRPELLFTKFSEVSLRKRRDKKIQEEYILSLMRTLLSLAYSFKRKKKKAAGDY